MQLVFDLDGCVIDNKKATRMAYELAGRTVFPPDWFYVSDWATEEEHRAKNLTYPHTLCALGKIRTMGRLLLQTGGTILSGCSATSMATVLNVFPALRAQNIDVHYEMPLDQKIRYLNSCSEPGLYFDDWEWACKRVREETLWTVVDASRC